MDSSTNPDPQRNGDEAPRGESFLTYVSPARARAWLETAAFQHQRRLDKEHVAELADYLRRGEFKTDTLELRRLDGREYLINGQHTLAAIALAGVGTSMNVLILEAPDLASIEHDYAVTDRIQVRSLRQAARAVGLDEELGLAEGELRMLLSATALIARGFAPTRGKDRSLRGADLRLRLMREWGAEAAAFAGCVGGGQANVVAALRTGGAGAVVLVTLRHAGERAGAFWRTAAGNDGLRRGTPAHTLVDYLLDGRQKVGRRDHVLARAVARCWNADHDGEPLGTVRVADPTGPILIAGTPYDGKAVRKDGLA